MKVELQAGDTITIPDGFKAVIKDGNIVFEKDFKDGDILISDYEDDYYPYKIIMIYKGTKSEDGGYNCYIYRRMDNTLGINEDCCSSTSGSDIRYATEEEKQLLFDKMKEQGLKWNSEEKRVEKIRWRAKRGNTISYFAAQLLKWIVIQNVSTKLMQTSTILTTTFVLMSKPKKLQSV